MVCFSMTTAQLSLKGFTFKELFTSEGLKRLDDVFLRTLHGEDEGLHGKLLAYRENVLIDPIQISELIIDCGPIIEIFIAELFGIEEAVKVLQKTTVSDNPIFAFKQYYVLRQARRALNKSSIVEDFNKLNQWF